MIMSHDRIEARQARIKLNMAIRDSGEMNSQTSPQAIPDASSLTAKAI
jgi:hypothetical protein